MVKLLSRDDILKTEDISHKRVEVKEWGGAIQLRQLSVDEVEGYEAFALTKPKSGLVARLLSLAICDDEGNRIFKDEDVVALGKKNSAVTVRLYKIASKMNALSDVAAKELEKN